MKSYRCLLLVAALTLAACEKQSAPLPANPETAFAALEHDYAVFVMQRFPVMATYLGGAAFDPTLADIDGQLRDHSAAALAQEDAQLQKFRDRFTALAEATLTPRRRIDRSVALAEIEFLLRQHGVRRYQERSLDSYMDEPFRGVDWQIQGMTSTGTETYGTEAEWRQVIARTRNVAAYLATAEKQLAAGVAANNTPDWRMLTQSGLRMPLANAEYFSKTLATIATKNITGANRDALLSEVKQAGQLAATAYTHLREFIVTTFFADVTREGVSALKNAYQADRFAFGETEYAWALRNNLRMEKSAAQLFDESWSIVDATRTSMIALAHDIAATHKWKVPAEGPDVVRIVFDKLSVAAPKNDAEMIERYRQTGVRLVDYARRTGLFAVPDDYRLDVTETPPPLQSGIDGAAYYPAPPFKSTGVGRFYVTPTKNDIAMLRAEHNSAAMADLAAHEGFPGHDWHYKVMSKYRAEISPIRWLTVGAVEDSSSMWQDSMAAEGWALYSEALLAEPQTETAQGFYSPEERLYQLRGKLYRDLRVRIDTGIHTGRMQFDEAVTLFSEVVDFQPGSCSDAKALRNDAKRASCTSALGAINRYSRWPTQAITYRLGKDQILALRAAAHEELGEKFSLQQFHLEFMKQGTIPAGYFAAELLKALASK